MKKTSIAILGVVLLVWALTLTGCGNDSITVESTNEFNGTWTGTAQGHDSGTTTYEGPATLKCEGLNWALSFPDANINESGTIRRLSQGPAFTLYQGNTYVGAGLIEDNIITSVTFNFGTASILCRTLTKQ